jgi:hypothetical protein
VAKSWQSKKYIVSSLERMRVRTQHMARAVSEDSTGLQTLAVRSTKLQALLTKHYVQGLRSKHYSPITTDQALRSKHYSPITTVQTLQSKHYDPRIMDQALQSKHYCPITTVQALWSKHYTTVQALLSNHYGPSNAVHALRSKNDVGEREEF